jgi:hypothetical protein
MNEASAMFFGHLLLMVKIGEPTTQFLSRHRHDLMRKLAELFR